MLTPEYLAGVSAPLQDVYAELQTEIEADIARRIKKAGYTTDTAAWQIEKLKQMGESQKEIAQAIASKTGLTQMEVRDMFAAAGIKSSTFDEATRTAMIKSGAVPASKMPFAAAPAFRQVMEANLKRTMGTLQKLTGTMATDASGQLNKYLDKAQLLVQSGGYTQQQAIDMTVQQFADDGIHTFDYASGVRTSVEAAVRRALVTGINQATAEVSLSNAQLLGTDLVEVTSHADARPEHAAWQGKIYSISGTHPKYRSLNEATGYGTGAGLCGWNCRHSFYAFVEGVSEAMPKEKYNPAKYYAEQKQRYNERMIRTWRRKANTLRAGGSDPAKAERKVRFWQGIQRAHVLDNDLARMYDREKVYGMGTRPPLKRIPKPALPAPTLTPEAIAAAKAEAKKEALRAASRERTRLWRESKKATTPSAAETAAKAKAKEAAEKAAKEAAKETIAKAIEAQAAEIAAKKAAKAAAEKAPAPADWKTAKAKAAAEKKALLAEAVQKAKEASAAAKKAADKAPVPDDLKLPKKYGITEIDDRLNGYDKLGKDITSSDVNGAHKAKYLDDYKRWAKKLTGMEYDALEEYTGSAYEGMNNYLRGLQKDIDPSYKENIILCNKALKKANLLEDTVVRRGSTYTSVDGMFGVKRAVLEKNPGVLIGKVGIDKGFTSASISPKAGFKAQGVEYRVMLPKGTNAQYIAPLSTKPEELEVLINKDTKYAVIDVLEKPPRYKGDKQKQFIVYMQAIPSGV